MQVPSVYRYTHIRHSKHAIGYNTVTITQLLECMLHIAKSALMLCHHYRVRVKQARDVKLCLHVDAGSSEPGLASRVAELERVNKKQRLTLTNLKDVGDKLLHETIPDSAWFEDNLAGEAFSSLSCESGCTLVMNTNTISSNLYDGLKVYKKVL